jgi:hypothetical protein
MRRIFILLLVVACGCQNTIGPLANKKRSPKPDPLCPDLDQQKAYARERFPYYNDDPTLYPNTGSDRPGVMGR